MPERFHPARYEGLEYVVDTSVAVEGMQLTAANGDEFAAWTEADRVDGVVNGGPAYLLAGRRPCTERVVGLGDYAMRLSEDSWRAERGSGFYQRYAAAEGD